MQAVATEQTFINLTGHKLVVYAGGQPVMEIPGQPQVARLSSVEHGSDVAGGFAIAAVTLQPPLLAPARAGVWIVVSQSTALALAVAGAKRADVVFPGPAVSERGRVVGCIGLRQLVALL